MPTNSRGQFEYPESDWAVGKMRMAKATRTMDPGKEYRELEGVRKERETKASELKSRYPTLSPTEWSEWIMGPPETPRLRYNRDHPLDNVLKDHPSGFVVDRDHPGLDKLQDTHELLQIPGETEGEGGPLFARPKKREPLVSEAGTQWSQG